MDRTEKLKLYDAAVESCPRFKRKGKTMPYTSANGYMFSLIHKDDELGIRFSKEVQEKYIKELNSTLFMSHGSVVKGYVLIQDEVCTNHQALVSYLNESFDYVMTLDPK